jgi:hypothetical protein
MIEQAAGQAEDIATAARARAAALCRRLEHATPGFDSSGRADAVPSGPEISDAGLQEAVALRAYFRAEQRGFDPGLATEDWLEAERELRAAARALADEGES